MALESAAALDSHPLDGIPLFEGLSRRNLTRLGRHLERRVYPPGTEIIQQSDPGTAVYVLVSGSVKIHEHQPDGTEVILAILAEEEVFGEMSVVDSLGRSANVTTLEETTVLWMHRERFWDCLREMPSLAYNLNRLLARRLRLANTQIDALASLDVPGRVARHLLALAFEYGKPAEGGGTLIPIPLTQTDLAELVGASRVRVNQVLGGFRRRRVISVSKHFYTVLDRDALARRCR